MLGIVESAESESAIDTPLADFMPDTHRGVLENMTTVRAKGQKERDGESGANFA